MNLICADILGDASGLSGGDVGVADCVEQGSFSVVDVTHDNYYRRTLDKVGGIVFRGVEKFIFNCYDYFFGYLCAEFYSDKTGGVKIHHLVDVSHDTESHQLLYYFGDGNVQPHRKFVYDDLIGQLNLKLSFFGRLLSFRPPAVGPAVAFPVGSGLTSDFLFIGAFFFLLVRDKFFKALVVLRRSTLVVRVSTTLAPLIREGAVGLFGDNDGTRFFPAVRSGLLPRSSFCRDRLFWRFLRVLSSAEIRLVFEAGSAIRRAAALTVRR